MKMRIVILLLALYITACQHRKYRTPAEFRNADLQLADSVTNIPAASKHFVTIKLPDVFTSANSIRLSDVIDSIWYVPLETNDSSLLSYIDQVNEFNGNYIVLDILAETIVIFDKKGKFMHRLGHKGKGPGEYLHPTAFVIDKENNEIMVHDDYTSKIIHYDKDGQLKREEIVKYGFLQFVKSGNNYIINSDREYNNHLEQILNRKLLFTSSRWKINHTAFSYDWETQHELATNRRALIQTGGHINYNASYTYDIYRVTDSSIDKTFFIDAGKYALPEGFDENLSINEFNRKYDKENGNKIYITSPPVENATHIMLKLNMNKRFVFAYYSKKTGKLFCNSYFTNDIPWCVGPTTACDVIDDTFVGYMTAIGVLDHKRYIEQDSTITRLLPPTFKTMCDTLQDIDNPVLTFFRLKNF